MSRDLASSTGVAGRYATALFELARDAGALEAVEADMAVLKSAIDGSQELQRFLKSPVYKSDDQLNVISALTDKAGFGALTANFLKLLAKNRRLFALGDIIAGFGALAAAHRGEVFAEAVAAAPMSDAQTKALQYEIEAMVGKAVKLETRVDQALLGGLVVKIGSKMIDASLKTKLNRIKTVMKEA